MNIEAMRELAEFHNTEAVGKAMRIGEGSNVALAYLIMSAMWTIGLEICERLEDIIKNDYLA